MKLAFWLKTAIILAFFSFHGAQQFAAHLLPLLGIGFLRYFGSNLPPGLYELRAVGHRKPPQIAISDAVL